MEHSEAMVASVKLVLLTRDDQFIYSSIFKMDTCSFVSLSLFVSLPFVLRGIICELTNFVQKWRNEKMTWISKVVLNVRTDTCLEY